MEDNKKNRVELEDVRINPCRWVKMDIDNRREACFKCPYMFNSIACRIKRDGIGQIISESVVSTDEVIKSMDYMSEMIKAYNSVKVEANDARVAVVECMKTLKSIRRRMWDAKESVDEIDDILKKYNADMEKHHNKVSLEFWRESSKSNFDKNYIKFQKYKKLRKYLKGIYTTKLNELEGAERDMNNAIRIYNRIHMKHENATNF